MGKQHLELTKIRFVDYIPWTTGLDMVTLR
jgi:hypothetical protein